MAISPSDFNKIWSTNATTPAYTFNDTDYEIGWDIVGNMPPTRAQWNAIQKKTDEKMQYILQNFGHPFVAPTVADMTDTDKVYVYVGSEAGYVNGDWYYYDEGTSSWVDGGVYNATALVTDTTLSIGGDAADAKATGDAVTELDAEMAMFGVEDLLWPNVNAGTSTSGGITYTVDTVTKTVTMANSSTGTSFRRLYYNTNALPPNMQIGVEYIAHFYCEAGLKFQVYEYDSGGTSTSLLNISNNRTGKFTFSANAVGAHIRIYTGSSGIATNTTTSPFISVAPSLSELQSDIDGIKSVLFQSKPSIGTDTNLDTIKDLGYYFISSGNTPHASNPLGDVYAVLFVYTHPSNIVTQVICGYGSDKQYIRRYKTDNTWTSWYPFVDDTNYMKKLGNGVSAGTDFNTLTETGFIYMSSGYSFVNAPPMNGSAGILRVYNTGTIITQFVNGTKTADQYVRRYFNGNWSNWVGVENRKSIKILTLGNSGHQDMLTYVPFIMQNVAPELDLTLGITYVSGASIDRQIDLFDNDDAIISFDLYKAGASAWTIKSSQTMKQCLVAEDWDIIMIGQNSTNQMDFSTYSRIPELIDKVTTYVATDNGDYVGHSIKWGYLAPQVRIANNSMVVIETPNTYPDYMDAVQQSLNEYPLEFAIMGGTAVMNARGTTLAQYGNAQFTDGDGVVIETGQMNYDYFHMQEGIGCMVGSYCSVLSILELAGINNRSIFGEKTRPDATWITSKNIPGTNGAGNVVGISDPNCLIAQKCAVMAHKKPFEVSTIY